MHSEAELLRSVGKVAQLAEGNRWHRLRHRPLGYPAAQLYRTLAYPLLRRPLAVDCPTFFGRSMRVMLPSGTDIFLTGGKTHESELRLARYLIRALHYGDTFLDIGAHYGYFALLAAHCTGDQGRVIAVEAAPATFAVLRYNAENAGVEAYHAAASDTSGELEFLEFPNLYAEYNTLDTGRYSKEKWYGKNTPVRVSVPAVRMDDFLNERKLYPVLIKIDVEGAEFQVIRGMTEYLENSQVAVAMEYLSDKRGNAEHRQADTFLRERGYLPYAIDNAGIPYAVHDVPAHLESRRLDSDNIVFRRPANTFTA